MHFKPLSVFTVTLTWTLLVLTFDLTSTSQSELEYSSHDRQHPHHLELENKIPVHTRVTRQINGLSGREFIRFIARQIQNVGTSNQIGIKEVDKLINAHFNKMREVATNFDFDSRRRRSISFSIGAKLGLGHSRGEYRRVPAAWPTDDFSSEFDSDYSSPSYSSISDSNRWSPGVTSGDSYSSSKDWTNNINFNEPVYGGPTNGWEPEKPRRFLTKTQRIFDRINRNYTLASRYRQHPEIQNDPDLHLRIVVKERPLTCEDLCDPGIVSVGLLGICTANYCNCGSHHWRESQVTCSGDQIFDPLQNKCDLPQNTVLCSDDPIIPEVKEKPIHLLIPIVPVHTVPVILTASHPVSVPVPVPAQQVLATNQPQHHVYFYQKFHK